MRVAGPRLATALSCQVTLTFSNPGLRQVPAQATLVLAASSSLPLTLSRKVTFFYYLGIPAIFGALMAIALLVLCMGFVRVYDREGTKEHVFRRAWSIGGPFWKYKVFASGAWTLNDSWLTNIATAVAVIGTVLGLVPATDALFRGVALDRFEILNAIAAAILVASPLVVAVRYARWIRKNPGVTAEASLVLPTPPMPVDAMELPPGAQVEGPDGHLRNLPGVPPRGTNVMLDTGAPDLVPSISAMSLAPNPVVRLTPGTKAALPRYTRIRLQNGQEQWLLAATTLAVLATACDATLAQPITVTPDNWALFFLPGGPPPPRLTLRAGTQVTLATKGTVTLHHDTTATLPSGAAVTISPATLVPLNGLQIVFPVRTPAVLPADALGGGVDAAVTIVPGTMASLRAPDEATATLEGLLYGPAARVWLPSGASITVPSGTNVSTTGGAPDGQQPTPVEPGHSIQVPPRTTVGIRARRIALPGGSDVIIEGGGILEINNPAGVLAVAGSDVTAPHGDPGFDVVLRLPAQMVVPAGAKITVNGVAQVQAPGSTQVETPFRKSFTLADSRSRLRWPTGDALVGTMGMIILAGIVTMFGVGVELGLALVLTVGLSEASLAGRVVAWVALVALALFTLGYSYTAVRALADPEPGSSMSSTGGTSFTL